MGCECNPKLCNGNTIGRFSNGKGILTLQNSIWVNAYNDGDTTGIILHHNCPFHYCNISSHLDLNDPNALCAMNHFGHLCGKCKPEFSLILGSNKCLPCSDNHNLALFIFFAAAGLLLVFFIKTLNMTCLLYTSPSPRDATLSRMPSSA